MNSYEPARTWERTKVQASVVGAGPLPGDLTMVDLSAGGMQLRTSVSFPEAVRAGAAVEVTLQSGAESRTLKGRVAWLASSDAGERLGVEFVGLVAADTAWIDGARTGQLEPGSVSVVLAAR